MYNTPKEFFFRLHHIRPRFKNNVEDVLIYVASEISKISSDKKNEFKDKLNIAIRNFQGNTTKEEKTINNWRTEISSLFGFFIDDGDTVIAGRRAIELSNRQDLVRFFKVFLYNFQYPGGHNKPDKTLEQVNEGIKFKPAQFLFQLLEKAEKKEQKRIGISKAELTHLIFNDLRVTSCLESIDQTLERFLESKKNSYEYNWDGDVIRYAGDILDYLVMANLLKNYGSFYYLNHLEKDAINSFVSSNNWFDGYDGMIQVKCGNITEIKSVSQYWFEYVNKPVEIFDTNILAFISEDENEYHSLQEKLEGLFAKEKQEIKTKEIGDYGENLTYGHECTKLLNAKRQDLIHLVKVIPNAFAVGYDIQSVELDERKRYIEVKTTISSRTLRFCRFRLTVNEWNTAKSLRDRYFVYRLFISKEKKQLFLLQDPVKLLEEGKITTSETDSSIEVIFNENSGSYEELLKWGI